MTTKRITFNLQTFINDLEQAIKHRTDLIDDTVQNYKDFLRHAKPNIASLSIMYVEKKVKELDNEVITSYIDCCHDLFF